jgi:hypothetical protein
MKPTAPILLLSFFPGLACFADDGYGPTGAQHAPSSYKVPADIVPGGAFIDRILPLPVGSGTRNGEWGGKNVQPRVVENGLEDPAWSYWCMSVHREADGLYHMFATRWPEGDPRGHNAWPESKVVHATSASPTGPFTFKQEIGPGHNVMCYRAKDGTYVLYVIDGGYTAKSPDGPWEKSNLQYDRRGMPEVVMSNHTFAIREDRSVLMVSRGGHVWISDDGLKPFRKITCETMFPKIPGEFEDPVIWRDEVQYHLIVNDWHGRTAFYMRSPDGVNWVWDEGKAYDIEVVRHPDGTKEGWHKLERPNVLQDQHSRATHLYLAAMDAPKDLDRGADGHSSKVLVLPLVVERRMEILPAGDDSKVRVKILAEEGFDPASLDIASLRFGPPTEVNRGKGAKAVGSTSSDSSLIVTFESMGGTFSPADPVAKLLGKSKQGDLVLGHVRAPIHPGLMAILSPEPPRLTAPDALTVKVENFGLKSSTPTTVKVTLRTDVQEPIQLSTPLPELAPYASTEVTLKVDPKLIDGKSFQVETIVGEPTAASAIKTSL